MKPFSKIKTGNERYPALTGIRALGATVVFFNHLPFKIGSIIIVDILTFFFVLSGFLIVYLYYEKLDISRKWLYKYFVNRFARIYPVYFLLVTIAILILHDFRSEFLFKNYTLTHALFNNTKDIAIQPSWSLTVEECFYFLAPLIMFLIKKFNFLVSFLLGVFLLLIALLISEANISFLHTPLFVFTTTFFGYFFAFYAGAWLAIIILEREKNANVVLEGNKWTIWGLIGIAVPIILMIYVYRTDHPFKSAALVMITNFILPVPVAVLYFGLICEKSFLSRILSDKIFGWMGRGSYSFYLMHTLIINYLALPFIINHSENYYNFYVVVTYIITQVLSILLFALYEEPLNMFIRKKFKFGIRIKTIQND
ncbi:MAG TPA: acyltransferase [Puia sp.]|nr:acyltransferase [Puia sp.]